MKNSKILFQDFIKQIHTDEGEEEIKSIGYLVFEKIFGVSKTDIIAQKEIIADNPAIFQLNEIAKRLNASEPIQYILCEAEFYGRTFEVSSAVLIPRPETEELVSHILKFAQPGMTILDIGTGSGCIPITLSLEIHSSKVFATDISEEALQVAERNKKHLKVNVTFLKHDILNQEIPFRDLDIIVSNPPYIAEVEKREMRKNVLAYEPHLSLFTGSNDPLIFYKAIAKRAATALRQGGCLITEINPYFSSETASIFSQEGFRDVTILKDLSGKDRIVQGLIFSKD